MPPSVRVPLPEEGVNCPKQEAFQDAGWHVPCWMECYGAAEGSAPMAAESCSTQSQGGGVPFLGSLTTTLSSSVKGSFCLNRECRGISARGGGGRMNLSLSAVKVLLETTGCFVGVGDLSGRPVFTVFYRIY